MGRSCSSNLFAAAVFWPSSFLLMRDTSASSSSVKPRRKEGGTFHGGGRGMDAACTGETEGVNRGISHTLKLM